MLNVKIPRHEDGGQLEVHMAGTVAEISTDVCIVINSIFNNLKNGPVPEQAEVFRFMVMKAAFDPNSPAWEPREGATHISTIMPKG